MKSIKKINRLKPNKLKRKRKKNKEYKISESKKVHLYVISEAINDLTKKRHK